MLAQETRDLTRAKSRAKSESPMARACGNTGQDCIAVKVGRNCILKSVCDVSDVEMNQSY